MTVTCTPFIPGCPSRSPAVCVHSPPGGFQAPLSVDPATCPIVPGQEMIIEISKGRSGLGLSIVGGKDTPLVSFQKLNTYANC